MCGIAGVFYFEGNQEDLKPLAQKMADQVQHRGPDAGHVYGDEHVGLGHRRLSIIDLSHGADQPMCNADQTVWIVFNGEIYNFLELREEFVKENYPFKTRSDTEVLIALYEKYGPEMLEKINGMFAFAIWDVPRKRMFLARDRLGKKPLFYYKNDQKFVFGSELKSVLVDSDVPREISPEGIDLYFNLSYLPGHYTILKNVYKLPPGHFMLVSPEKFTVKQYWDLQFNTISPGEDKRKYQDELYDLIHGAVRRRLISDVPLGAFLSGGVDSSGVVGMMSIVNEIPVQTYTIGYKEADYSEVDDARFIAEHFKTRHKELIVHPEAVSIFSDVVWHFDEPFADASSIATYYVSKMARDHVTVVLSGDGGDELFAGYTRYARMEQYDRLRKIPGWSRKLLLKPLADHLPLNFPGRNVLVDVAHDGSDPINLGLYPYIKNILFSGDLKKSIGDFHFDFSLFPYFQNTDHLPRLTRHQYIDIKFYLPDDILVKVDKMSMAVSLETRAPFLDYTIAEFAAKLPPEWQMENGEGKSFLKSVLRRYLPERVFTKPKHGFDIPKKHWFRSDLKQYAHDVLLSRKSIERGYFDPALIKRIIEDHAREKRDYSRWLWNLLNFEVWHQVFIDADTRRI